MTGYCSYCGETGGACLCGEDNTTEPTAKTSVEEAVNSILDMMCDSCVHECDNTAKIRTNCEWRGKAGAQIYQLARTIEAETLKRVREEMEPLWKKSVRRESGEAGNKYQQSIGETNGYHKVSAILDTLENKEGE